VPARKPAFATLIQAFFEHLVMSQHCNATRTFTRWGSLSVHRRTKLDDEYDLVDTPGFFDQGRYFDVLVEYAKADA
jgi:hypothetical protein